MKSCAICNKNYPDAKLNFCLDDGGVLIESREDAPPTLQMNQARTTQPVWAENEPLSPWENQPLQSNQPFAPMSPNQPFAPMMFQGQNQNFQAQNQTLAIVSLCLGLGSVTIGWCCSLGLVLAPAALITGLIALSQIKKDPVRNGGRGLAIGGVATGAAYLALLILIIIIYGIAFLGSMG